MAVQRHGWRFTRDLERSAQTIAGSCLVRLLTSEQAIRWCRERRIELPMGLRLPERVAFDGHDGPAVHVPIVGSPIDVIRLAYVLLMTNVPGDDAERFAGALLCFVDWDIWSETTESVGHAYLNAIRDLSGEPAPIGDAPGLLCRKKDFKLAHAALALPMMFQWDAWYVAEDGGLVACIHHHGYMTIFSAEHVTADTLYRRFEAGGHNPSVV
ncbi:MAG TPA: hypothetical protein VHW65_09600 [Gemmatimonadales bacterium]|nr:hypothetical protein [Gemmatimonadales bacterium]